MIGLWAISKLKDQKPMSFLESIDTTNRIMIGASVKIPKNPGMRVIIFAAVGFQVFFMVIYQTKFITDLTGTPVQLSENNEIETISSYCENLQVYMNEDTQELVQDVSTTNKNQSAVKLYSEIEYTSRNNTDLYNVCFEEKNMFTPLVWVFSRKLFLIEIINRKLLRLVDAGFVQYHQNKYVLRQDTMANEKAKMSINIDYVLPLFLMHCMCLFIGFIALSVEMIVYKFKRIYK
ncbi:uncharacterized protein LOC143194217 [Rhynchophorus ferrugineus]|uniref:uncharacterized protein LOC143194217 n=1 Tax=Rhynchophorus ferrugineus TaxID=354439 RepID=UPI003FCE2484